MTLVEVRLVEMRLVEVRSVFRNHELSMSAAASCAGAASVF